MKGKPGVFCIALFLSSMLLGYPLKAQEFEGRLILGVNGSQLDGDEMAGFNKGGLVLGLGASYPLDEEGTWAFQPELLFSQKGSQSSDDRMPFYKKYRLNYIEVPLRVQYKIGEELYMNLGINTDFLLSAEVDDGSGFFSADDRFKDVNWNVMGGFEYQLFHRVRLNFSYGYSIARVTRPYTTTLYHNYIMATLRYRLANF